MKLYDVIIKEFTDDDNIKNLAKLLTGNPIDNGVSIGEFRTTFKNAVGYDPTTIYDYAAIDKIADELAPKSYVTDIEKAKETSKQRFDAEKYELMGRIVADEMHAPGATLNLLWKNIDHMMKSAFTIKDDFESGRIDSKGRPTIGSNDNPTESHPICDLLSKPTKNYELDDEDDDFDDDLDDDFDTDFNDDDLDDDEV